jgi:hypothetical protein
MLFVFHEAEQVISQDYQGNTNAQKMSKSAILLLLKTVSNFNTIQINL